MVADPAVSLCPPSHYHFAVRDSGHDSRELFQKGVAGGVLFSLSLSVPERSQDADFLKPDTRLVGVGVCFERCPLASADPLGLWCSKATEKRSPPRGEIKKDKDERQGSQRSRNKRSGKFCLSPAPLNRTACQDYAHNCQQDTPFVCCKV